MGNVITGLDIGSSSIKGVVASRRKDGGLDLVTAFRRPSAGFRKGVLVDIDEALSVFRQVIIDLEGVSKHAAENIFVNINGEHIRPRVSHGVVAVSRADQEIQQDDVDRVFQSSQAIKLPSNYTILHNIISQFFVDDVPDIKDPVGMSGNRLEVQTLLVEAFEPHITTLTKALQKAGGDVGGIIFAPLAAARAVLSKRQKDLGVALVDIGSSTTSVVVYEEGKIVHAKSIPLGSSYVTNDIAIGLKTSIDVAELLKTKYGMAVSKDVSRREKVQLSELEEEVGHELRDNEISQRFLSEIIEVRLEEILDLIDNELKDLGRAVQLPAGIVLTGGGVKLTDMEELVRQTLKLPVQIGYPDLTDVHITNPTYETLLDDPTFATALGLLYWGDDEERPAVSGLGFMKQLLHNLMP